MRLPFRVMVHLRVVAKLAATPRARSRSHQRGSCCGVAYRCTGNPAALVAQRLAPDALRTLKPLPAICRFGRRLLRPFCQFVIAIRLYASCRIVVDAGMFDQAHPGDRPLQATAC